MLQQQVQLMENLKELDWKIERYESSDAKEKIDVQVAYVIKEKQEQQLAHGFRL